MSAELEGLATAKDHSEDSNYLQYIPANISYNGPANVKSFFTNFTKCDEKEKIAPMSNVFRGRPLNGSVVELPDEYSAWVLKGGMQNQSNTDEEKHAKNIAVARTQRLTVWNYDKPAESDNPISRGLQWTKICDAIAVSDSEGDEKENMIGEK